MDWIELVKVVGEGVGVAVPLAGLQAALHRSRSERFDRIDVAQDKLEAKVAKLDSDFDGVTRQIGDIVNDVQSRFLTRDEGVAAIQRLDTTMIELNRSILRLSAQLLDLARDGRGRLRGDE